MNEQKRGGLIVCWRFCDACVLGAYVNKTDNIFEMSALGFACKKGHIETVKVLLDAGMLWFDCMCVKMLFGGIWCSWLQCCVQRFVHKICWAGWRAHTDACVRFCFSVGLYTTQRESVCLFSQFIAVLSVCSRFYDLCISGADLNLVNTRNRMSALHCSCLFGHAEMTTLLLKSGMMCCRNRM